MRRLFLTIGVLLALVIGVVPAFADNGAPKAADEAEKPVPGAPGTEAVACPRSNSSSNEARFSNIWGEDMFVLQRATRGTIVVRADFDNGSPAAKVRLHNVGTNIDTAWVYINTANPGTTFPVPCGSFMVQIKSANMYTTVGNLYGSP